jgi:membrane-bound lytic murein transglycosylase D
MMVLTTVLMIVLIIVLLINSTTYNINTSININYITQQTKQITDFMHFKTFITLITGVLFIQSVGHTQTLSLTLANPSSHNTPPINPDSISKTLSISDILPSSINTININKSSSDEIVPKIENKSFDDSVNDSLNNKSSSDEIVPKIENKSFDDSVNDSLDTLDTLDNLETAQTNDNLWARIRRGFAIPTLDTPLVTNKTLWYARQPEYMARMTERGKQYLFYIVEELERRNMPSEIALLPFIESAFNPQAISSAKAAGIWQFMPATGKHFNLKQNVWLDERRGVVESTRAALDYLQKLYSMFGDWHLALAAYNWGEGSVQRAINKNRAKGLSTDYLSLNMPDETSNYVPKFQAIKNIIQDPAAYGIQLTPLANTPYFTSVVKNRDIDVSLAAKFAGMSLNEFKALNPSFKKPVILGVHSPEILLPTDRLSLFNQSLSDYKGSLSSWTTVTLSGTERPTDLAKRYGLNERLLREINNIPARMLLKAGSTLIVPKVNYDLQTANISANLDNAKINLAPELVRRSLTVYKKDTWAKIANRANVSRLNLQQWNRGTKLRTGATLSYYAAYDAPVVIAPITEPMQSDKKIDKKYAKNKPSNQSDKTNKNNKIDKNNKNIDKLLITKISKDKTSKNKTSKNKTSKDKVIKDKPNKDTSNKDKSNKSKDKDKDKDKDTVKKTNSTAKNTSNKK